MEHNIYSVHDSKAETFLPPFFQHKQAMALRIFSDCCNDKEHTFGHHPEDYTLFSLGTYDDDSGHITQDKITSVANGLQLIQPKDHSE